MKKIQEFWNALSHAGVQANYSNYLTRKVILTNQIGAILFVVSFASTIPSWNLIEGWQPILLTTIGAYLSVLLLNWLHFHSFSRLLLSLLPISIATTYHATSALTNDFLNPALQIVMFGGCLYPFIFFGLREKWELGITAFLSATIFLGFPYYVDLFPYKLLVEEVALIEGMSDKLNLSAVVTLYTSMIFITVDNYRATKLHTVLRQKTEEQNQEMQESRFRLNASLRELEEKRKADKQRSQISHWLTAVNDTLRTKISESELYTKLISQVIEDIGANQGGIYSVNYEDSNDIHIELVGCYAYEGVKLDTQRIEIGQGLLGQCYFEKEKILLKEIPKNYTKITSGLGEATPAFLAIVPLKTNQQVEGFIEVASFEILADYQIEFLERTGESIASFMASSKAQKRTEILLRQSQKQAEELRIKEEEMRQNMEELRATQEKVQQKEEDYIQKIKLLEDEIQELQWTQ